MVSSFLSFCLPFPFSFFFLFRLDNPPHVQHQKFLYTVQDTDTDADTDMAILDPQRMMEYTHTRSICISISTTAGVSLSFLLSFFLPIYYTWLPISWPDVFWQASRQAVAMDGHIKVRMSVCVYRGRIWRFGAHRIHIHT